MRTDIPSYADWLEQSAVPQARLTPAQQQLLHNACGFLQEAGTDYYSRRFLSHFLLHCRAGLTTAAIARLCGFSRSSAVDHRGLSTKEVVQAAHHRLAGRAHGKLLPRYAGPLAEFLLTHPEASRYDTLDFVRRTWGVSVSRVALHRFLKKYGLDQTGAAAPDPEPPPQAPSTAAPASPGVVRAAGPPAAGAALPLPPPEFFLPPPSTPAPSCSCPTPSTGWPPPPTASRTPTARCGAGS